jgi:membrane-associated protein
MNFLLQTLIPYLLLYKYITIFVISFGAAFIVPIPSGSILMASSAFARIGYFNLFWVIVINIIGNILGDNLSYFVARRYGREVLSQIGFRRILESKNFIKIEDRFSERPGFLVFASRFEVLSTLSVNLLSGLSKTPYRKYLLYESIGSVAQVCMYSLIGYFFANSWESINTTVGKVSFLVGVGIVLIIIFWGRKSYKKRKKESKIAD